MLLARAEGLPRQDQRERDLAAGLDSARDLVPDREAELAVALGPFLATHCPPMFERLGT
jgi:hypothetical protein